MNSGLPQRDFNKGLQQNPPFNTIETRLIDLAGHVEVPLRQNGPFGPQTWDKKGCWRRGKRGGNRAQALQWVLSCDRAAMIVRIGVPGAIFDAGNPTAERKSCLFALRAPHTGPAAAPECKSRSAITQVRGFGHVGTSQPSCLTPPLPVTLTMLICRDRKRAGV